MSDDAGLLQFAQQFRSEVIARASGDDSEGGDGEFKENVFTTLFAEYLADAGAIDDAETCFYSRRTAKGILKVSAYAVDEETRAVDLFVAHYTHSETPTRLTKADVIKPLEQLIRFYKAAGNGLHHQMEPAHDDFTMVQRLSEASSTTERIRCFFLTDGLTTVTSIRPITVGELSARCEVWDIERLYRASMAHSPHESITIDFVDRFGEALRCLQIKEDLKDYKSFVAIIPGAILSELYDEYGSRLLELNVRSFLQARGKVNKAIRDTLKNAPERFLAYNNGISATAEHVELVVPEHGHIAIRLIRDLQIVNGGQTTASIHRAEKEDKIDLNKVFVQAKISVVDPACIGEFVPLISKYANSQNAVREADFSANDSFHVELERLSETTWCPGEQSRWFYERARGQYQVAKARESSTRARKRQFDERCPTNQKFTKTDLAKFAHSWQQLPHLVSKGAQKNFVEFMLRLKNLGQEWQPDATYFKEIIAQAILFKGAQRIVRQLKIPAYGANVVTYTISYLASRSAGRLDLNQIWEKQQLPEGIATAIQSWAPRIYEEIVASSAGRNVTEWAKKEDCWRHIRSLVEEVPAGLDAALKEYQPMPNVGAHAVAGRRKISDVESENIARVMQVSADAWFQVSDWGRKTGKLKAWQAGIAHTLSGYASGGWEKVPSVKQANQAVKILELAITENPELLGE